jgi:hypothetical protein
MGLDLPARPMGRIPDQGKQRSITSSDPVGADIFTTASAPCRFANCSACTWHTRRSASETRPARPVTYRKLVRCVTGRSHRRPQRRPHRSCSSISSKLSRVTACPHEPLIAPRLSTAGCRPRTTTDPGGVANTPARLRTRPTLGEQARAWFGPRIGPGDLRPRLPGGGTVCGMWTEPATVTLPGEHLAILRELVADGQARSVSAWIADAVAERLAARELGPRERPWAPPQEQRPPSPAQD